MSRVFLSPPTRNPFVTLSCFSQLDVVHHRILRITLCACGKRTVDIMKLTDPVTDEGNRVTKRNCCWSSSENTIQVSRMSPAELITLDTSLELVELSSLVEQLQAAQHFVHLLMNCTILI